MLCAAGRCRRWRVILLCAAGRCRSRRVLLALQVSFGIGGHLAVEAFLALLSEGDDDHAVLGKDVARADIDSVAVKCPVAFQPTGTVECIEVVAPVQGKVAAVFTCARGVLVDLDPVDELVNRQDIVVPGTDPAGVFVGPEVEAEALFLLAKVFHLVVVSLSLDCLADDLAVENPGHIIRSPFHAVSMEGFVGCGVDGVVVFASHLAVRLSVSGAEACNDVGLETVGVLAQNFDIHFDPGLVSAQVGVVVVEEHGADGS